MLNSLIPKVDGTSIICQGLLPLRLASGRDRRDSDRALLLLRSLRHFWDGGRPFQLHVVGRDDEASRINELLKPLSGANLEIVVHTEGAFFPRDSKFHLVRPEYKQQLIKLFVPWNINLWNFITFDADVVAIRQFNEGTFFSDGALLSKWEGRGQAWWEGSMRALRCWSDNSTEGLSVTPNTLNASICQEVFRYFELRGLDAIDYLCDLALSYIADNRPGLAWSEYSLYTLVGEWFSSLGRFHLPPEKARATGIQFFSNRCVWHKSDENRLTHATDDKGYFLIVQSWAGVPLEKVEAVYELAKTKHR